MATAQDEEKYRRAVGVIAANCGAGTKKLITSDRTRFKDAKVRAGRHVPGVPAARDRAGIVRRHESLSDLVYDTVAFTELTSRLHRALGMIRREAAVLKRAIEGQKAPDRLADRLLTLDLSAEQSEWLRELLTAVETVNGPLPLNRSSWVG